MRDDVVIGLALAIQPTGVRSDFLSRMVRGRRRYANIGRADGMTIPEARREARRLIASYIEPAKKDSGPRTPGHPMTAFVEEFLARQAHRWKPRTVETNSRIVRKDILPAFGDLTVDAITVEQVRDWFAAMSARPGIANRAMPVLSMMMRMAELWGYRRHNSNPCTKTRRYLMKPMERFLTADEMARLNAVLTRDEFWCPHVVAIVRLLMLTGCRLGEIASLEWDWIKGKRIHLPDSKSGPPADAACREHPAALGPHPQRGRTARPAASRPQTQLGFGRRRERRGHGDHRQAARSRPGRDYRTHVHLSDQSVADAADRISNRIHTALAGRGAEDEGGCDHARS